VTDAELVERTLAGFEDGFGTLVARYQRSVYNLLVRMLRNPALAEDLAQETFLKAFSHLRTFDRSYKFSNWILRIAHNTAIDALRRRGPLEVSIDEPSGPDLKRLDERLVDPGSDEAVRRIERQDLSRMLDAALDCLRPDYRQAVVLRYQEGLSYEEIAGITGVPIGTVKSNLHRARAEMAAFLTRSGLLQPGPPGLRRNEQDAQV
jgi:RNA polymerase sigma-70 factor, ECF subfamily